MRPFTLALLSALALVTAARADEIVTRYDLETGIGETVLENGLRILTLERHDAPVVSSQIWYRAGSADEEPGATGVAHFLEHLMFKGTDRYARGEIDRITLKLGGSNNAGTSKDWTYYYFNLASDRWETALEIEANRMRNLTLDPKEVEAERKVVIEELQVGRDAPWGELDETLEAIAFSAHPYRHPIIGWRHDVETVTLERIRAFYDRHYHPGNAILVIVGDFDTRRALSRIVELFGDIPTGPDRPRHRTPEPAQNGARRIVVHRPTGAARIEIMHHTVPTSDPDDVVLDVISQLLAGSKASRQHRRLVTEERLVNYVSCANDTRKEPGIFWNWAEVAAGRDPADAEKAIHEETARLGRELVGEEELARAKSAIWSAHVFRLATVESTADAIGNFASVADWRMLGTFADRLAAVTAADVRRVAARVFRPANRTVGIAVPRAEPRGSETGGGHRRKRAHAARGNRRSPGAASGRLAVRLSPVSRRLPSGLRLVAAQHGSTPVFAFEVILPDARLHEAKPGLANLTGELLLEGAGDRTGEEIALELDRRGARIVPYASRIRARSLSADAPALIRLVSDVVRRPTFPAEAFERVRARVASELAAQRDDPETAAYLAFREAVYGAEHPLGYPSRGTAESLPAITHEDVAAHWSEFFRADEMVVVAVSDRDPEKTLDLLTEAFADLPAHGEPRDRTAPARPRLGAKTIRIPRDTDQSNVFLGHLGIARSDPDYFPLLVMDYVLGMSPGFTDRLSRTLRDEQGLAYSVYATISGSAGREPGTFTAYIGTSADQERQAIEGIVAEIERIRTEPVDAEELADSKAYLTGSFVFGYETAEQVARALGEMVRLGLGFDYPRDFARKVMAVTAEDVLRVARKHLHPDRLVIATVGPNAD